MLAALMTEPDFAEVMFLIGFILFLVAALTRMTRDALVHPLVELGLAAVALGLFAL